MASDIVRYTATDGQEITLTPEDVLGYIASGGAQPSRKDVVSFMAKCQARGLNPLAGDAYLTVYNSKEGPVSSVIVSKEYFTRTAAQQETFQGFRAGIVVADGSGTLQYREGTMKLQGETLVGGWAEVIDSRWKVPARAEVSFDEYNQQRSLWRSKPCTMIRKVALVQALREAYPIAYGGLYDSSEMPSPERKGAEPQIAEIVDVQPTPPKRQAPAERPRRLDRLRALFSEAKALGVAISDPNDPFKGLLGWIHATYGCEPDELGDAQIGECELYAEKVVADAKSVGRGAERRDAGPLADSGTQEQEPHAESDFAEYDIEF